jgi:hypothetical protein
MFVLYIDPGAGSLVIQAIIAGIVSVPFFFRTRLRSVFGWAAPRVREGGRAHYGAPRGRVRPPRPTALDLRSGGAHPAPVGVDGRSGRGGKPMARRLAAASLLLATAILAGCSHALG